MNRCCDGINEWLTDPAIKSERDYAMKKQELENICKPIIVQMYSGAAGITESSDNIPQAFRESSRQPPRDSDDHDGSGGPIIDEVD